MHDLETHGGMVRAIEDGICRASSPTRRSRSTRSRIGSARPVVGVNKFVSDEPAPDVSMYELDAEGRDIQLKRLSKVKADRDSRRGEAASWPRCPARPRVMTT